MIRGQVKTFDFRFGDEFVNFLEAVGKASITLDIALVNINGQDLETETVRFNYQDSITKYKSRLGETMYRATDSLKGMLDSVYEKIDKLSFLAHFIIEIEACRKVLFLDPRGLYAHKQFSFANISIDQKRNGVIKTEDDFQEYYYWMEHYLEKMYSFLLLLKAGIEVTTQSEITPLPSMKPDANASSQEKPFEYFDYLFNRSGIAELRRMFMPGDEAYYRYPDFEWNAEEESISYSDQDQETGVWESYKYFFKDQFRQKMYDEYLKSRRLIDDRISRCANKDEAEFYVQTCLGHLKYFLKQIPNHADSKKYSFLENFARGAIVYLFDRYGTFCGKKDDIVESVLKDSPQPLPQQEPVKLLPSTGVTVFKVKGFEPATFAAILYLHLKSVCFEENVILEAIGRAFSGNIFEHPLKIKWVDKARNGRVNKQTLLYFFNQLAKADLIEEDTSNAEFLHRLHFVFVDGLGQPLQNLGVSNASSGSPTKNENQSRIKIKEAIKALLAEKMTI
jgi:hypothetical protein